MKTKLQYPNPKDFLTFDDWFVEKVRYGNAINQMEVIESAKVIKRFINNDIDKIPSKHKWLYNKITNENNLPENYIVPYTDTLKLCNEILNPRNASSKKLFSKAYMKQGVEADQIEYLDKKYNLLFSRGIDGYFPITANGKNSYRFTKNGEFKQNIKKTNNTTKSIDSCLYHKENVYWTTQKRTGPDGGATNSVQDDIVKFLRYNKLYLEKKESTNNWFFLYLLDGPYWQRKDRNTDMYNRIETLQFEYNHPKIIITTSDEFGIEYGN